MIPLVQIKPGLLTLTEIDRKSQAIFENRYGMIGRFAPRRLKDGIDSLTAIDLRVGVQDDSFGPISACRMDAMESSLLQTAKEVGWMTR